jgi:hypothetical protein
MARASSSCVSDSPSLPVSASALAERRRSSAAIRSVVVVRDGRAEDRDDRVADELLHRAAEALELVPRPLVVDP